MNVPVAQNLQLPAHLAALAGKTSLTTAVLGGIQLGAQFHSIGIKAGRWRLNDPQGQEEVVQTLHLDAIVLDGNPFLSRKYWQKSYDPSTEPAAPDCFSDNGVGPSVRAAKPQCGTCAACPNNVLGSKINPNGSKSKACSDSKLLAVILADNPTGPVYQMSIPHMSQKNLFAFADSANKRGVPLAAMVVRMTFDPAADYPLIRFTPLSYADVTQAAAVMDVLDSDEVSQVLQKDDTAIDPASFKGVTGVNSATNSPQQMQQPYTQPPAPMPAPSAVPAPAVQPQAAQPASAPAQAGPRKRRTKAELAAAADASAGQTFVGAPLPQTPDQPQAGGFFQKIQEKTAPQVQANPQPADAALDAMLAAAFKV